LALGFVLNFFGIKLFRFVIGATGFILFVLFGYIILINVHLHAHNFGANFDRILGIGVLVFGVVGILLSGCLWRWFLLGLGAMGGVSTGLALFSTFNYLIPVGSNATIIRPFVMAAFAIIGALLLRAFERPLIIFATSISGALLFCFGLDTFLATGFDLLLLSIIAGSIDSSTIEVKMRQMYGVLFLWIGLTIIGMLVQFHWVGRHIKSHTKQ
jgi:hypothetical protein